MKIVVSPVNRKPGTFKARGVCPVCESAITRPEDAVLAWGDSDDEVAMVVHRRCYQDLVRSEHVGTIHQAPLSAVAAVMR